MADEAVTDTPIDWEARVADHIDNEQSRNQEYQFPTRVFGRKNAQSGGSFSMFMGRDVILEQRPHELDLDQLQRLPEYLCDLSLRSKNSEIGGDHFQFWAWTGALASSSRVHANTTLDQDALADLCVLIQLALFTYRDSNYPDRGPYWNNPSYLTILIENYNLVTLCGYPTLEGLLRRRCKETKADGTVVAGHESVFEQHTNGGRAYLGDTFNLWREENTSGTIVADTLNAIDDLEQERKRALDKKFQDISISPSKDVDVLLFFKNLRNMNLHGESNTQVIASVIVTLACLVFLDTLDQDGFDTITGSIENELNKDREELKQVYGYFPSGFYPLNKEAWKEPDEDGFKITQTEDGLLVWFGKDNDFYDFQSIIETLAETDGQEAMHPRKFEFISEKPDGDERVVVDFSSQNEGLEQFADSFEQVIKENYPGRYPERPYRLWIDDNRSLEDDTE